jgi:hypothetical protein
VTVIPDWPDGTPGELRLWAHRVTDDGESEPLEARIEPSEGDAGTRTIVLGSAARS